VKFVRVKTKKPFLLRIGSVPPLNSYQDSQQPPPNIASIYQKNNVMTMPMELGWKRKGWDFKSIGTGEDGFGRPRRPPL
jgi:hypothetical protein